MSDLEKEREKDREKGKDRERESERNLNISWRLLSKTSHVRGNSAPLWLQSWQSSGDSWWESNHFILLIFISIKVSQKLFSLNI